MVKAKPVRLEVQIQSNAIQNKVMSFEKGVLKLKIAAPPVEGKANQKLLEFISDVLGVTKSNIIIKTGLTSKHKILEIDNLSPNELNVRLKRLVN